MNRLKELRIQNEKTQAQVAAWLSITQAAYSKYECGRAEPSIETLSILCEKYGVSLNYLLGRETTKNPPNVYDVDGLIRFPELGTICAGFDGGIDEMPTGEIVEIPLSMINGEEKENYFVLRVQGDSMYPRLLPGDRILCKRCDDVDSGTLAVVIYDSECATVKRVVYPIDRKWTELQPINPEYTTKRIEGADLDQCHIIGKVIKLIRDL